MAKREYRLKGDYYRLLDTIDREIMHGSFSASFENGSDWTVGGVRCAVRVYERYSIVGSNRVSLNVTVLEQGGDILVSAITSGGSQAMFFKLNVFGEEAFLTCLDGAIRKYNRR